MKFKLYFLAFFFVFLITGGAGCFKMVSTETKEAMTPVYLEYWRPYETYDAFTDIIAAYNETFPHITIAYRKLRYDEYENELLNAFAEDRGPDIFSIQNTWVRKYKSKLEPMPAEITIARPVTVGSLKKETIPQLVTERSITLRGIKDQFVDVVYDDVVVDRIDEDAGVIVKDIYALPLFVDTMVLYYNRDLLNNAGIIDPPKYWNKEFQEDVAKLTKQNSKGRIVQSGIALGGSDNIERYGDILSVLMMQSGATMAENNVVVKFNIIPPRFEARAFNPGLDALRFYTDFAKPAKEVYCWNNTLENSLDMFVEGKLAYMLGYSYHRPTIQARAPKMNFGISNLPQIEGNSQINFANYWVEVVSKKSANPKEAWHFIQFMTKAENVASFLAKTKKPTALRALITEQLNDDDMMTFAQQLLTADSWYRGYDVSVAEKIMGEMIDDTVEENYNIQYNLNQAAAKIQQTMVE